MSRPPQADVPCQLIENAAQCERTGDWDTAAKLYANLFDHARAKSESALLTFSLYGAARVRRLQGSYEEAEELAELCWRIAELHGLGSMAARAMNVLAAIRHSQQDLTTAKTLYTTAQELAFGVGDDELIGFTSQNLGVISSIAGDLREAKAFYLESVGSTVRSGDRRTAMGAYNNLAIVCADLKDWMEAKVYFDRGIEIAEQLEDVPVRARLQANQAEPLIHTGDLAQARITLDIANRLANEMKDVVTLADVARYRAMIARFEGDLASAEEHLDFSLRLTSETGLDLEHAEALEELACLRDAEGHHGEAVATLNEAHGRYEALGAKRDAARTREVLESWSVPMSAAASTLPEVVP